MEEQALSIKYYDRVTECVYTPKPITNTCENGTDITFLGILVSGEGQISDYEVVLNSHRFVKMVCTGIKDDKGNCIYTHHVLTDGKGQKGVVFYKNGRFLVNWRMEDGSYEVDDCFYGRVTGTEFDKSNLP